MLCKLDKVFYISLVGITVPSAYHLYVGLWDVCLSNSCGCIDTEAVSVVLDHVYFERLQESIYFLLNSSLVRLQPSVVMNS